MNSSFPSRSLNEFVCSLGQFFSRLDAWTHFAVDEPQLVIVSKVERGLRMRDYDLELDVPLSAVL